MLTRDFTWSRNLSQEFAVSRSRPAWVAVVIGREKKTLCYFHRCEKTVESRSICVFLQASGFLPAPERSSFAPVAPPAARLELSAKVTAAMSQRGIVSDWSAGGKRKIGEDIHRLSHPMHSFSTSTILCKPAL